MRSWNEATVSVMCLTLLLIPDPESSWAQQEPLAPTALQSVDKRRLLEEANRVEAPHFALRAPASPEAVELAHQLEAFAKEIQVAWLKRGLEDEPLPADISARLSPEGAAHRKKFVSYLEEMATLTLSDPIPPPRKPSRKDHPAPSSNSEPRRNDLVPQATPPTDQQGRADESRDKLIFLLIP